MIRNRMLLVGAVATALTSLPAFSQEEGLSKNEVTVQALGSFLKTTTSDKVEQSATNSGGVLASYRYFFNRHSGVEANYGYTQNTQNYSLFSGSVGVPAYSHEISAAYVYRLPMKRWTPFALAGTGGLIFDPKDMPGSGSQARAAFIYGAGADFSLTNRVYVRAEYRGLVYNSPTFDLPALAGTGRLSHRAEPSIGFGYRF